MASVAKKRIDAYSDKALQHFILDAFTCIEKHALRCIKVH